VTAAAGATAEGIAAGAEAGVAIAAETAETEVAAEIEGASTDLKLQKVVPKRKI